MFRLHIYSYFIRIEASPSLRLVDMDVTNEDHVRHALDYVAENLPAGQQGKTIKLLKYTEEVSVWTLVLNYIFYLL